MSNITTKKQNELADNKLKLPKLPLFAEKVIEYKNSPVEVLAKTDSQLEDLRKGQAIISQFYGPPATASEINKIISKLFHVTPNLGKTELEVKAEIAVWVEMIYTRSYSVKILKHARDEAICNDKYRSLPEFLDHAEKESAPIKSQFDTLKDNENESLRKLEEERQQPDIISQEKSNLDWSAAANGTHHSFKGEHSFAKQLIKKMKESRKKPLK